MFALFKLSLCCFWAFVWRKMFRELFKKVGIEDYIHPEDEELYHGEDNEEDTEGYQYHEEGTESYQYYEEDAEGFQYYDEHSEGTSQESTFSCESCDRDFYSEAQYHKHMSEHRTCNLDGCKFTAHEKIVEKHVLMQHATGLYDKIRNINTPEDIAKWVEERKRRYPSKENILKRQERQEERLKRGERIKKNENRFGKDKYRLAKNLPKKKPKKPFVREKKPVSLINEKIDWNGNMYPFKGTSVLESDSEKEQSEFEDDEWTNTSLKPVAVKFNNALGALMGAYMSGESDEEAPVQTKIESKKEDSDGEPPTEIKIQKEELPETIVIENKIKSTNRSKKRKRPKQFNKSNSTQFKNKNRKNFGGNLKKNDFPYGFKKRKVTLLEKLLESEIRHERNVLLQCIRFTVENNFFMDK